MVYTTKTTTTTETTMASITCMPCTSTPCINFKATYSVKCNGCGTIWSGTAANGTVESCSKC